MTFGGNLVTSLGSSILASHQFCDDLYAYSVLVFKNGTSQAITHLKSARIFLLEGQVKVNNITLADAEESVQIENLEILVQCLSPSAKILLVGAKSSNTAEALVQHFRSSDLKRVEKPWGYEVWITGEHPQYCLKKIFIKKGTRTSLQYHNQKRETNVLFEGTARLHYKKDSEVPNDHVEEINIGVQDLENISVIDVFPHTVHRIEAVSNILLYEASTPQLDDVVRISDDSNRGHGRIHSEHEKK